MNAPTPSAGKSNEPTPSDNGVKAPAITLPKGGGAIRGMGEKFAANPVTGTGSLSVPIATSPGRSGFGPQLSLSYDSGAGNGPFGFGWHWSLPSITRKTDKGLPQYHDADESDIFILSGAEDLMPELVQNNDLWQRSPLARTLYGTSYQIQRYRPRIEGLFARIERWMNSADPSDTFWRSISKDNITTWYGKTEHSRIVDPDGPTRIFTWLICESYDDKGNVIAYDYKSENSDRVGLSAARERNRTDQSRAANRYLKRIHYGNRTPYFPDLNAAQPIPLPSDGCFEVVFDYGEHDASAPVPQETGTLWEIRNDPFSTYRATFEVRTYRLCQRILMFHHFPDEPDVGNDCLIRSTDFTYTYETSPTDPRNPIYSFLHAVTQVSYRRTASGYRAKALPPLEFEYTLPVIDETVIEVDPTSLENLPYGLDGTHYQWVDLDGEGLSGILTEQAGNWFYKRNLSPANLRMVNGKEVSTAHFAPVEVVARKPSLASLNGGRQNFLDLAGDGQLDLVEFDGPTPGFFERTDDADWAPLMSFSSLPVLDWHDPNLKFVDLTGDGHADLLISEDYAFCWHASLAEAGFGPAQRVQKVFDEEKGPALVFADSTQSIFLADLSGDGLTDIARIRNGEICYWPNLGYGCFGAKVTMDNSPWFEAPDLFDGKRIHLADLDGTGTTDIVYLGSQGVQLYFNQSGNGWGQRRTLSHFPRVDNLTSVTVLDLLGNGTACLAWSSPLPGDARRALRYIDLMGGQKPHLLVKTINNLGAQTRVQYAASTKFYVADKLAGTPWITKLPFPVHVVERVDTEDLISRNRFVTSYTYHHGYFDGVEREFRGFGRVEQKDTEAFAVLSASDTLPDAVNIDAASHVPPILTKTWFHTGAYFGMDNLSKHFAQDYYREGDASDGATPLADAQFQAMLLDDTVLPTTIYLPDRTRLAHDLTAEDARQASRALKGSILRQEIYALDGSDAEDRPCSVSERNYTLEILQPPGSNPYGVFFTHARETINFHYERTLYSVGGKLLADPRVGHALTLDVDPTGNVRSSAAIGYGRRHDATDPVFTATDKAKQKNALFTYAENDYTQPVDLADAYRTPLVSEARSYELLKIVPKNNIDGITNLLRFDELIKQIQTLSDGLHDLPYEDFDGTGAIADQPYRRLIEQVRTLYSKNDLSGALPLGQLESMALPFESYKLAFTPTLLTHVFGGRVTDAMLGAEGAYVHSKGDANWWIASGRMFYSPNIGDTPVQERAFAQQHFFLPQRFRDPFGNTSTVAYDPHNLLVRETRDALGNTVSAAHDYRVLAPYRMTDPNGNRTEVAFDTLGLVAGSAVMGKVTETQGDLLTGFIADLDQTQIDAFFTDPKGPGTSTLLAGATTRIVYDVDRYYRLGDVAKPTFAATLARETHLADPLPPQGLKLQVSLSYSDGFGREIQKKIPAEAGPLIAGGLVVNPRWVGSGWTVFNNKGKPVRQYEPFFDDTHDFRFGRQVGVSPTLFYDPALRVVATLHPNHSYEKVVFDPWRQETWDVNDNVLQSDPKQDADVGDYFRRLQDGAYLPSWYDARNSGQLGPAEQAAAKKTAAHTTTPTIAHFDALGRPFLTLAHNGYQANGTPILFPTRVHLDIEGNQREVRDAIEQANDPLGRIVMRYDYSLLGTRIHQASMEAGERWMLNDITGKPVRAWDSRGHEFTTVYDELRRPLRSLVIGADVKNPAREFCFEQIIYGESAASGLTAAQVLQANLRGKPYKHFDTAGVVTSGAYDFKGNLLHSTRQLLQDYKATPDWLQNPPPVLETEIFASSTRYDALNRPLQLVAPHSNQPNTPFNIIRPGYNEANLLERVEAWLGQTSEPNDLLDPASATLHAVTNIDYNAKGQRELIEYGNRVGTRYNYDPLTFRLIALYTARNAADFPNDDPTPPNPPRGIQNLSYTYDPAGNITTIRDDAQQTIFFNKQIVVPQNEYTYDALYRLTEAKGREHIGQLAAPETSWNDESRVNLPQPGDVQAMRNYTEQYLYDAVGNFEQLIHQAANGNWTRIYAYEEVSTLESGKQSNRLTRTTIGATTETYSIAGNGYDMHGNMLSLPHLTLMQWDFKDQLNATARQVVNVPSKMAETTFYVYDAAGQRVRKITEGQNGLLKSERVYLGGFELYREFDTNGAGITLERETLHIMDDKQRIALVETRTQGNDGSPLQLIRYQFGNHLGSASLELDDQGKVISYEEYFPYGSTSYQAVDQNIKAAAKRYRYTGKERDEETGFSYHGARYYAAWLGRWVSCDPSGLVDGSNLYQYVKSNPMSNKDPSGMETKPENPDGGAPDPKISDAGAANAKPNAPPGGGVRSGEGGYEFHDYEPNSNRIEAQDQFAKGAISGFVNTAQNTAASHLKDAVKAPIKLLLPNVPDVVLDQLPIVGGINRKIDLLSEKLTLESSGSNAGGAGYVLGMAAYFTAENLAASGLVRFASGLGSGGSQVAARATTGPAVEPLPSAPYKMTTESGKPTISFGEGAPSLGYKPNATPPTLSPLDIRPGPGVKAVAGTPGGPLVMSGVDETAIGVFQYRTATGQSQLSHFRDIQKTPGTYFSTHAEGKAFLLNPTANSVTVSKPPCVGCIEGFKAESTLKNRTIEIHAPTSAGPATWTFRNGGAWVTPFMGSF